jgi:hypothetical protein
MIPVLIWIIRETIVSASSASPFTEELSPFWFISY